MESSSTMQKLSLPKNLRSGQKKTAEKFYEQNVVVAKLPTGYGKTLTSVCSYAILRKKMVANRVLYVVPRANQAKQAAASFPKNLRNIFGIETTAYQVGISTVQSIQAHRDNLAEVFVVTIQSLVSSEKTAAAVSALMSTGKWFVVVDEHHHYSSNENGEGSRWAETIKQLPAAAQLIMSATPNRHDGKDYFPDPSVSVTYLRALEEGAVKEMRLNEYEYQVDTIGPDGEINTFKTSDLCDAAGGDTPEQIDAYIAKKDMRWSPKYISPLILAPAERMARLRANGIRSQMIVQAMSCTHAEMVCKQISTMLPTLSVDWVGTGPRGRTMQDNAKIIDQFCPEEDDGGDRNWSLDVLVNVGIAGEGLDTKDCTEIVCLTPARVTISFLQLAGRGARVMRVPKGMRQPKCHINVDTDSEVAKDDKYLGVKVMALFDEDVDPEDVEKSTRKQGENFEYEEIPDELVVKIADVRLVDIKMDPDYEPLVETLLGSGCEWTKERVEEFAEDFIRRRTEERNETLNASAKEAKAKAQVDATLTVIVTMIMSRMNQAGMRPQKDTAGDLKKKINSKKKSKIGVSVQDSTFEQLKQHHAFLKDLERSILLEHGLRGLPSWLR